MTALSNVYAFADFETLIDSLQFHFQLFWKLTECLGDLKVEESGQDGKVDDKEEPGEQLIATG